METNIAVFRGKNVRRLLHNNEWWFSIVDVCGALTESADAGAYWRKLKQRLKEEGSEVVTFCHGLKLTAPDGKLNFPRFLGHSDRLGSHSLQLKGYRGAIPQS
jgi:hypothetical protein